MRQSVTTPGGFFIGVGGIVTSLVVAWGVHFLVTRPSVSTELQTQQVALGLKADPKEKNEGNTIKIDKERDSLLSAAAAKYNGGTTPNIDNLEELRGVVRLREAQKSVATAEAALHAPSAVSGKDIISAAMELTLKDIQSKPEAKSADKIDLNAPPEPISPPSLPNIMGGGTHTVIFSPIAAPAAPAADHKPSEPAAAVTK